MALARARSIALLLTALLACGSGSALAAELVPPSGLSPGDEYRLIFGTNDTTTATSTDIADYNAFVTSVANGVSQLTALGTTWTAIVSTPTVDARDNTGTNPAVSAGVPIYELDGTLEFSSYADMWDGVDGSILRTHTFLEDDGGKKTTGKVRAVWTGTGGDGTAAQPLGTASPTIGTGGAASGTDDWIDFTVSDPLKSRQMYAISGILTVPEPATLALVALGVLGYGISHRRRR